MFFDALRTYYSQDSYKLLKIDSTEKSVNALTFKKMFTIGNGEVIFDNNNSILIRLNTKFNASDISYYAPIYSGYTLLRGHFIGISAGFNEFSKTKFDSSENIILEFLKKLEQINNTQ